MGLINQDECRAADGPAVLAKLIGEDQIHARRFVPLRSRRSCLECFDVRRNEITVAVLHQRIGHFILQCVGIFHVANRSVEALNVGGDPFIALAAYAGWPGDRGAFTHFFFPFRADFGQIVHPYKGRAGTVRTVDYGNVLVRQVKIFVERGNGRVVPFLDLAKVDVRQNRSGQPHFAGLDPSQVDHRDIAAYHGRELQQTAFFQLFGFHGHIARTKIYGTILNLLDTAARANRLVVHLISSLGFVGFRPFGVDGVREGRPRAGDFSRKGRGAD